MKMDMICMGEGRDDSREVFLREADSHLKDGIYEAAQDLAQDWLARFPEDVEARTILCHAWMRMGKLDQVRQALAEVEKAITRLSQIFIRMGDICHQSGLNQEAIAFYQKYIALNPDSAATAEVEEKLVSLFNCPEGEQPPPGIGEGTEKHVFPGLQTVTMAELYARQGHRDAALEVLKAILVKDRTDQRAQALLTALEREDREVREPSRRDYGPVIQELARWLQNVGRIGGHAA